MLAVQITVRDIPVSSAIETNIRKRINKLSQFYEKIISCHVVIELVQKHKHQGKLFNIRINLNIPKKEFVVSHKQHQDIYIAIREAFSAMERQLEEYTRKRHGRTKTHDHTMHGHVIRLFPKEGYGFIKGADNNEYYFSLTNVHHGHINLGDAVEYMTEQLSEGVQAHHIVKLRNHRILPAVA